MKKQHERIIIAIVQSRGENIDDIELLGQKNLSSWKEFKNSRIPLQPDIDMLLCKRYNNQRYVPLHAIEFKTFYIKEHSNQMNYSYYKGLDQALALLNFGVDYVSLFHCFIFEIFDSIDQNIDYYLEYSEPVRNLIISLNLPIGYTACFTFSKNRIVTDNEEVLTIDRSTDSNELVIKAKRNLMNKNKKNIRNMILKKLNIIEQESMIKGPLIR